MDVRKRKRGIRASREKLEAAMLKAGFDTQSALAYRIAEMEGIDKPPKDLVSKVFREQAVSTHNLTRIANALDIEAHVIYLTKEEDEFDEIVASQRSSDITERDKASTIAKISSTEESINNSRSANQADTFVESDKWRFKGVILAIGFLLVIAILVFSQITLSPTPNESVSNELALSPPLGKVKIIIQTPTEISGLARQFSNSLSKSDKITSTLTNAPSNYNLSTYETLDNWQVHGVLKLYLTKGKYYQLITATLSSSKRSEIVLQSMLRNSEVKLEHAKMTAHLLANIEAFIDGKLISDLMTSSQHANELLLRAKNLLFVSHSATNFQTILDYLDNAIQLDSKFSHAYAEACRTNVRMSWIKDENSLLEKAAEYCNRAKELNPQDISTLTAQAELLSRIGEVEKAIELLQPTIENSPNDVDTLVILANLYLTLEGQNQNNESADLAEQYALKAISLEPKNWNAYNTLGNLYFTRGQMQDAKKQFVQASKEVKHEVILANLGTLQLCFAELNNAKQTYLDIIANFEGNYIGYENLGSVYFFEQNYPQALTNKLIAIEKQPDVSIHQIWGGVAEVYLQIGQTAKAIENYTKALTLIERDELLENVSLSDELHKLYYQQKLNLLNPIEQYVDNFESKLNDFISKRSNLGIKARSHLAWLAGEARLSEIKQQIWQEITQVCKVYEKSPELLNQI